MKKHLIYISLFIFLFSTTISAQKIGIKTTTPKAGTTLHIDAQGNTPTAGNSNCEDDVIVDNDGKMALGKCAVSTDAKLEVNGTFRLSDGAATDRVLMSDGEGNATWQSFALGDFNTTFRVAMDLASMPLGTYTISGTASFIENQLELTSDGISKLTIPAGRYLLSLANNIDVINENGIVFIYINGQPVFDKTYDINQSGATFYVNLTQASEIEVKFQIVDVGTGLPYIAALPYTNPNGGNLHMWAQVNVVRIQRGQ
ncbi:hypothetical protein JI747_003430 [Chryseobacterium sp. RG1]|uniref:Uncharacterized protein n=1 Tax=Chryseobacterium tagetis TaxID=2801334 RepID=A0ABS8A0U3_9FLAO|nr:hypothetical protein [Chryseobacterium tagetis]MCA6066215.1 hypothetical protein [Chryseobacterium tagetis]